MRHIALTVGLLLSFGGADAQVRGEPPRAALVGGNTRFAFDLYDRLRSDAGNLFFSPYSISVALAMTYAGADGETARQMAETLHLTVPRAELHSALRRLDEDLKPRQGGEAERDFQLSVANALWGQEGYVFLPAFTELLAENYGAGLRRVDFADTQAARDTINAWVERATQDKIQDLIPPGVLSAGTRLVLTNAIYFKAAWDFGFSHRETRPRPFHLVNGGLVEVLMMRRPEYETLYLRGNGYQAVSLPYRSYRFQMLVVVPDRDAFGTFERTFDADELARISERLEFHPVTLELPKFTFESTFSLSETLRELGMADAFVSPSCAGAGAEGAGADFSRMDGRRCLSVSAVLHKAFVAVDERGTEAAAATMVDIVESGSIKPPVHLRVDRPFLFLIRDTETGTLLFIGRVLDPLL